MGVEHHCKGIKRCSTYYSLASSDSERWFSDFSDRVGEGSVLV
jgi:hypothetical protein